MPGQFYPDYAMKAQQWEIAKGHLRALVQIQGSYGSLRTDDEPAVWEQLQERVESFIKDVEDNALHE